MRGPLRSSCYKKRRKNIVTKTRFIGILLVFSMLLTSVTVFADTSATTVKKGDGIRIVGKIDDSVTNTDGILNIYLVRGNDFENAIKTDSLIGHIGQVKINADGSYDYKFNFDKNKLADYNLYLKCNGENVINSVTITEINGEPLNVKTNIVRSLITDGNNTGEKITVTADGNNLYGNKGDKFTLIIGYYDEIGILINTKLAREITMDYLKSSDVFNLTLDKGIKTVKCFVLDKNTISPVGEKSESINKENIMFKPDEKVVFVGDSITHAGLYEQVIETYYATRHPEYNVSFRNRGINMDTGDYISSRLDWNILNEKPTSVSIMFGMNDCGNDTAGFNTEKCIDNWNSITEKVAATGAKLYCMTPTISDNYPYPEGSGVSEPVISPDYEENGLPKVARQVRKLADEKGYYTIEQYNFTNDLSKALAPDIHIIGKDRLHPSSTGYYAIGCNYLYEMGADPIVATVSLDSVTGSVKAQNAEVSNISLKDGVSYTYSPKSVPLPYTGDYKLTQENKFFDADNLLNREVIKVSSLADGTYEVKMNNKSVGMYTNEELENGINIATNVNNPNQEVAKNVFNKLVEKRSSEYNYQQCYAKWVERFDTRGKKYYDAHKGDQAYEELGKDNWWDFDYSKECFDTFPENMPYGDLTAMKAYEPQNDAEKFMKLIKLLFDESTRYTTDGSCNVTYNFFKQEFWNEWINGARNKDKYYSDAEIAETEARALSVPLTVDVTVTKVK